MLALIPCRIAEIHNSNLEYLPDSCCRIRQIFSNGSLKNLLPLKITHHIMTVWRHPGEVRWNNSSPEIYHASAILATLIVCSSNSLLAIIGTGLNTPSPLSCGYCFHLYNGCDFKLELSLDAALSLAALKAGYDNL